MTRMQPQSKPGLSFAKAQNSFSPTFYSPLGDCPSSPEPLSMLRPPPQTSKSMKRTLLKPQGYLTSLENNLYYNHLNLLFIFQPLRWWLSITPLKSPSLNSSMTLQLTHLPNPVFTLLLSCEASLPWFTDESSLRLYLQPSFLGFHMSLICGLPAFQYLGFSFVIFFTCLSSLVCSLEAIVYWFFAPLFSVFLTLHIRPKGLIHNENITMLMTSKSLSIALTSFESSRQV